METKSAGANVAFGDFQWPQGPRKLDRTSDVSTEFLYIIPKSLFHSIWSQIEYFVISLPPVLNNLRGQLYIRETQSHINIHTKFGLLGRFIYIYTFNKKVNFISGVGIGKYYLQLFLLQRNKRGKKGFLYVSEREREK